LGNTIISFIVVFGILVLFHEFGHFIMAKANGIKVNEFAIGIGPKVFKIKKGETLYSIRAFPLGGFVKMEGENKTSEDFRSFYNKSPYRRLSVIAAGPIMNFVLAFLLLSIIFFNVGFPNTTIEQVIINEPAEINGIQSEDEIVSINGENIDNWDDIVRIISESTGDLDISVVRNSDTLNFNIQPKIEQDTGRRVVGIIPQIEKSFFKALQEGYNQMVFLVKNIFSVLKDLISGNKIEGEIVGPIGIMGIVGEAANDGILSLLFIAAYLSINLGIINLLPFPALDGGHLVFILIEIIRGKPIPIEKEGMVNFIGFAILMALMVLIIFKDISKLF